jgi:predicted alpha/beta hydrolase family esterase
MQKTVVIIHGSYGSPEGNWFPWLADAVREAGHLAVVPRFPTPEGQSLESWLRVFEADVGQLEKNFILVGHSLGAAFALRLLEQAKATIAGTFLVSGFLGDLGLPDFDRVNADFVRKEVDWKRAKAHSASFHVYSGDNDPYVPLDRGKQLAKHLGVNLVIMKNAGHINADSGFQSFPTLFHDLSIIL